MKYSSLILLILSIASASNWAVLVCGSNGFWNYRHHADVAHAYQIMKKGGIPEDHIITMMYNDVPFAEENPFPGELYNHPGNDIPNVYEGIVVDYQKEDVNPKTFMKVLLGDESAGGKVLKSTKDDNVFLYFSDHGGFHNIAFPVGGYVFSEDLLKMIQTMHGKQMYKKFVLYIEACVSGSMFTDLPEDLNVVAITAANDHESSWGWYCNSEAVVKDKTLITCLGDEFSVSWMEHVDNGNRKESLNEQFKFVEMQVTKSHVSRYGDMSFKDDPIGEYVGYSISAEKYVEPQYSFMKWNSRDNKLMFIRAMIDYTSDEEQLKWKAAEQEEMKQRSAIEKYFASLTKKPRYYLVMDTVDDFACYKRAINQFVEQFGMSDYALKYYQVFANLCNENSDAF